MYYECFMRALLIVGIFCSVLLALVGEFILSFLCALMSFCVYMRFIVSLRWKGKGMKMKDKEMLQIWLRLKEEAAYERGIFFTLDEIIRRCGLDSFPVDYDGLVLRVEQVENICDDIRSRYLDTDFHI